MFSQDLENIFCQSKDFVEKGKDGNHLMQGLVNMLDREVHFFLLISAGNFLRTFHAYITVVESISLH